MRVWREISEDEQLKSAIELTESSPGFGLYIATLDEKTNKPETNDSYK